MRFTSGRTQPEYHAFSGAVPLHARKQRRSRKQAKPSQRDLWRPGHLLAALADLTGFYVTVASS